MLKPSLLTAFLALSLTACAPSEAPYKVPDYDKAPMDLSTPQGTAYAMMMAMYRGDAQMVDVSDKPATSRIAVAKNYIKMLPETFDIITEGRAKKGDVLGVARLAGIMAAKQTATLIPLCHPLPITKVSVDLEPDASLPGVRITATVKTTGQTGVEMEALTAASVAALTVYDMTKAVDKGMEISGLHVVLKDGGKSGRYEAP